MFGAWNWSSVSELVQQVGVAIDTAESQIDRLVGVVDQSSASPTQTVLEKQSHVPANSTSHPGSPHTIDDHPIPSETLLFDAVAEGSSDSSHSLAGLVASVDESSSQEPLSAPIVATQKLHELVTAEEPIPNGTAESQPIANVSAGTSFTLWSESESSQHRIAELESELLRVLTQLQTREEQLQRKSEQFSALFDENQQLKESLGDKTDVDSAALTREFSERIGKLEKKYQTLLKDRDSLKRQLQSLEENPVNSVSTASANDAALITQLRHEGEQLQSQIIKYEGRIKALRSDKQQLEKDARDLNADNQRLRSQLQAAEERVLQLSELERKHESTLDGMKNLSEATRTEVDELRERARTSTEKCQQMETQLEAAWTQTANLKRQIQESEAKWSFEVRAVEEQVRNEMNVSFRSALHDAAKRETYFQSLIADLRITVDAQSKSAQAQEEEYESRIMSMQAVIQELESRLAKAASASSDSTKPLLRRISELQLQLQSTEETAQGLEASFRARLAEQERAAVNALSERNMLVEQLDNLQQQCYASKLALEAMESRCLSLEQDLQKQQSLVISASTRCQDTEEKLERLKLELLQAVQQRMDNETTVQSLRVQLSQCERAVQDLSALNDRLMDSRHVLDKSNISVPSRLPESVAVTYSEIDQLYCRAEDLQLLREEKAELEQRYIAALELLGEQTERVNELQNDLFEAKQAYKQQIEDLCKKFEIQQT